MVKLTALYFFINGYDSILTSSCFRSCNKIMLFKIKIKININIDKSRKKQAKSKKRAKIFGRKDEKPYLCIAFQGKHIMIGLWCNGSTTGFGSVCPGSNPGSPTRKRLVNNVCESFSLYPYQSFPSRIAFMTLAGARSANHSFFMKSI